KDHGCPEYIVDDSPLKQGKETPGSNKIPVVSSSYLAKDSQRPMVILILAWNFSKEIIGHIKSLRPITNRTRPLPRVLICEPFPSQSVKLLHSDETIAPFYSHVFHPFVPAQEQPKRVHTVLLSHVYNEEFLLPFWIRHHAPLFDYCSTD